MRKSLLLVGPLLCLMLEAKAQSTDDVLNLLIRKNVVSQKDADSVRAEAAILAQNNLAKIKSFPVNAGKKISLNAYTQVRYQALKEAGKMDGFDVRRARLDVKGLISPYWSYRAQFDLAGSPKLLDAYAELKINDLFNFTIGQAKIPFSLENLISSNKLELIDRSQAVEALTARSKDVIGNHNGRDMGIQLGGTILKLKDKPLIDYRLGIYNGAGINTADTNEKKDLAARLVTHPIAGLDIGAGVYKGSRYIAEVKNGNVVTSPARNADRNRWGMDLNYDWNSLTIRAEYLHGKDDATKREGYYMEGAYSFFQKKLQLLAKYDYYNADNSKADDASTWVVFGANLNFNANARLQFDYTFKEKEGTGIGNNYASIQLQIGF